ncbi:hypothetical protein Tco_0115883 [Tanacetum coccineum]
MKDKLEYKGNNVVGALINVPIFVGTFSVLTDFAVLEDMDAYRDEGIGDVIFGEPFLREVGVKARRFDGMITIYNGNESVSEEEKKNGISHPYQKLKGFYKGVMNLGPEYIRDEKIEEWLTRGHISVHEMEWHGYAVSSLMDTAYWMSESLIFKISSFKLQNARLLLIFTKIQAARDRQKSYANVRRKPLEFQVGDKVMLKVSPWKGVIHFRKQGKLNPRYIGPVKVLAKVGTIACRLELPQQLSRVHSTFHVSNLKKWLSDESLMIPLDEIHIDDKLHFIEDPWKLWIMKSSS